MKVSELIDWLKQFDQNQEIALFDEDSCPMKIEKVVVDSTNDGLFNCIVLNHVEQ